MQRHFLIKGFSLISLNLSQVLMPFVRTVLLTRILSSFEFGFTSALSASYSTFELITDIAIHRFVFASPRSEYREALAGAHALSIVRGAAAGTLAVAAAPGLAYVMSLAQYWTSFAWLGLAIFIRSFEHFEVKVSERDYQYNSQFKTSLVSDGTGLAVMIATWLYVQDHTIYITMLLAQNISYVLATHYLAKSPYRVDFRSVYFSKAARFAYPLIFSGLGLAAVSQGDRLLVGSVLDLPTLGVYSVMILVTTVPIGAIVRITSSIVLAGLHNAAADRDRLRARLLLYMRVMLILGVSFAFGLLGFMDIIVPFVFGPRFTVAHDAVALLALASFVNIARAEPTTSLLLVNHRTHALAMLSLSTVVGLFVATVLAISYRNIYVVLLGRLVGEIFAFGVSWLLWRRYLHQVGWHPFIRRCWAASWVMAASFLTIVAPFPDTSFSRLSMLGACAVVALVGLTFDLHAMIAKAYGRT
jgi:O-antigen/teichoic acid export membrane protein